MSFPSSSPTFDAILLVGELSNSWKRNPHEWIHSLRRNTRDSLSFFLSLCPSPISLCYKTAIWKPEGSQEDPAACTPSSDCQSYEEITLFVVTGYREISWQTDHGTNTVSICYIRYIMLYFHSSKFQKCFHFYFRSAKLQCADTKLLADVKLLGRGTTKGNPQAFCLESLRLI